MSSAKCQGHGGETIANLTHISVFQNPLDLPCLLISAIVLLETPTKYNVTYHNNEW